MKVWAPFTDALWLIELSAYPEAFLSAEPFSCRSQSYLFKVVVGSSENYFFDPTLIVNRWFLNLNKINKIEIMIQIERNIL